ncbi:MULTISPECIES: site-specific DNA-methyltransferase [unclassified Halomonas]|uniref:site-specific DNA-methyltransferase n=1 Tax=unclassified Halomonas TaxID=2609666 RepID=UPI00209EA710|nr:MULTISPECIES: site-specific DNA-methyltransferase [unclassified Halomonas]MCP1314233.1 site-specific DNA-methyltransferase [Halomonas sp. 707D7]MCP1325323.1 site-specific DNA-methyltransferase [Halomonas sp. 707D4]
MDKLKMHSPNLTETNIAKLAELFPSCVTEARDEQGRVKQAIDFDQLRQELSDHIVEGPQERYHLNWPGKRGALLAANAPTAKTLRPCNKKSIDFSRTKNIFVEGDNLEALRLFQETYLSKVKVIYIDPPYNTGKEFVYNDNFSSSSEDYLKKSNQHLDSGGRLVTNTESNGRYHSDWLSMMYPRLKLARNLLSDDGAIFISIDDHEIDNLRKICDEVFGSANFIAQIIWHKMDSPKNSAKYFSEDHDYIVVYAKDSEVWRPNLLPRSKEMESRYKNPDNDPRGPWLLGDLAARNAYSLGVYPITTPSGKVIDGPPAGSYWRISKEKFEELDRDGRIWWGESGSNRPGIKRFLSEVKSGVIPQTYWSWKEVGSTRHAKRDLSKLMEANTGDVLFDTPKPPRLIKRILQIATSANSDDIVLDFFAGSGSTAEAVMGLNQGDGGNRRFFLVQLPEEIDGEEFDTISNVCCERLRRCGEIYSNSSEGELTNDVGYRFLKIDSSNMRETHYSPDALSQDLLEKSVDNIREGRKAEDLLFQVLLDWGVDLSLPISRRELDGKTVFFVDGAEKHMALAACFDLDIDEAFVKQLAEYEPLRVVFRDAGFASDSVKINVEQIFAQKSPNTDVKVI